MTNRIQQIDECFQVIIPMDVSDAEINYLFQRQLHVSRTIKAMLNGELTPEELLEAVEPFIDDIDGYIEEIEINLADLGIGD